MIARVFAFFTNHNGIVNWTKQTVGIISMVKKYGKHIVNVVTSPKRESYRVHLLRVELQRTIVQRAVVTLAPLVGGLVV